jgi:hypothetical protein
LKEKALTQLGQGLTNLRMELYDFRIDAFEPSRVWYTTRITGESPCSVLARCAGVASQLKVPEHLRLQVCDDDATVLVEGTVRGGVLSSARAHAARAGMLYVL